jgi:hypothetical protein
MTIARLEESSAEMLVHDTATTAEARRIIAEWLMPAIDQQLQRGAERLAGVTGLPAEVTRLSLAHRLAYAAKALEKLEASRAKRNGVSQADIARATGRNPSNIRRVYPELDEIAGLIGGGQQSIVVDGIAFRP